MKIPILVFLAAIACRSSVAGHPPNAADAVRLVNQFIAAESVGNWRSADSLVSWKQCYWDPAQDFIPVTTAIQVQQDASIGDSASLRVVYEVVGSAWSGDQRRFGPKNARFEPQRSADTVIYRVYVDSTKRLRIACGRFHQDHVMASHFSDFVAHFDDRSRAAWDATLATPHR